MMVVVAGEELMNLEAEKRVGVAVVVVVVEVVG